jgi:hypothetical protein
MISTAFQTPGQRRISTWTAVRIGLPAHAAPLMDERPARAERGPAFAIPAIPRSTAYRSHPSIAPR